MIRARNFSLWLFAIVLGVAAAMPQPVQAQDAELIGRFDDWDAYTRGSRRGEIFFLVWHRPDQKEFDVVQVDIGYPFRDGSEAEIRVGGESWNLFTRDESAWTYKAEDDKALVAALRAGSQMTVKGVSSRGNPTTDTYSLKGTSAAHAAIGKACGRG